MSHESHGHLTSGFIRSATSFPDQPALWVDGVSHSYRELFERSMQLAGLLANGRPTDGSALTAVLGQRSITAYSAVLAIPMSGHGYVPLNLLFPPDRSRQMLERAGCRTLIADSQGIEQLAEIAGGVHHPLRIVLPDIDDVSDIQARLPAHRVLGASDLAAGTPLDAPAVPAPDDVAYLLFTSGSTGMPKGVMVAHRNVSHYLNVMIPRYGLSPGDRASQVFDLTFDLSVHDMFVTWGSGACLYALPQQALIKPGGFIREHELTMWFSVPSTCIFMERLGALKPDQYPTLRWSLFCGEPLPVDLTRKWAAAAPNSILENLYGPTECTIAATLHRWDENTSPSVAVNGVVPIGDPYPGMSTRVVDDNLREVPDGSDGELLLCGPQVSLGYLDDPEKTAAAFVIPEGATELHYRTGDRVRRTSAGGPLVYLGRTDHQVQVAGHRVELGEIEATLREVSGRQDAIALGWPESEAGATAITAFLGGGHESLDVAAIRATLATVLPRYMIPRAIHVLDELPTNANGKFDRNALRALLNDGSLES